MCMGAQALNKTESTKRKWRGKVKTANTDQPLLTEVEKHIYLVEVSQINNVLSVLLYKMISLKPRQSEKSYR